MFRSRKVIEITFSKQIHFVVSNFASTSSNYFKRFSKFYEVENKTVRILIQLSEGLWKYRYRYTFKNP